MEASESAAPRRRRPVPPADRCHLGYAGQHLLQRRLHQLARRQVRQERPLGQIRGALRATSRQFNTPHSIAADAKGNIYVADRGNRRIQVFDPDGSFLREIKINVPVPADAQPWMGNKPPQGEGQPGTMQTGSPWAVCITPGPTQYFYASDAFPGRVYKMTLDGKVLGVLGKLRPATERVWLDSRNRLPVGEYDHRRRTTELAHAEADSASR